eukprot:9641181-Heterocapsa_arctica.AAC.1
MLLTSSVPAQTTEKLNSRPAYGRLARLAFIGTFFQMAFGLGAKSASCCSPPRSQPADQEAESGTCLRPPGQVCVQQHVLPGWTSPQHRGGQGRLRLQGLTLLG